MNTRNNGWEAADLGHIFVDLFCVYMCMCAHVSVGEKWILTGDNPNQASEIGAHAAVQ